MPHQNPRQSHQTITHSIRLLLAATIPFFASVSLDAATVNWGTPQTISTAANDVETDGILVFAMDASSSGDGTSSVTVTGQNGADVEFASYDAVNAESISGFSSKFRDDANFGGGSSDYGGVVNDGFFHGTNAVDGNTSAFHNETVVLSGLTIGEEYLIQYWSQDADRDPTYITVLDGATDLILDTDADNAIDYGQFVVGTFIADATSQSFAVSGTLSGSNNYGRSQLNAVQLRHLADPFIEWHPSVDMYRGLTTEAFVENWSTTSVLAYNATTTAGVAANPTIALNNITFTSIDSATLDAGYTDATSGVTIQAATTSEHATAFQDGAFSNNGDIYNVIASGHWALNTFTISGLTPGTNYQIQVFNNDARRDAGYQVGFSDGSQSHADSLIAGTAGLSDLNNDDVADESGDSIIGYFTAVASTQSFAIRGTSNAGASWNNGGQAQINALQIAIVPGPLAPLTLTIGNTPKQQMRYGIDYERLWFWTGTAAVRDRFAEWSVDDCDVDYVRVAISAKYELTEGVYQEDAYFDDDDNEGGGDPNDRIIPMMQDMKDANPDIKYFASPRPLNEAHSSIGIPKDDIRWQPYPLWITGAPSYTSGSFSFDEVKCAEYLIRYLLLMKSYGFKISYMDLTNEWNFVTPTDYRDISGLFDAYLLAPYSHPDYPGVTLVAGDIPQLVGASAWSYSQGSSWLNGAFTQARRDAIDIVSSHNTDRGGTAQDVADKVEDLWPGGGKEIWNTEVHGWKSTSNADEVLTYAYMMECINAGFSGLNGWLAVGFSNHGHSYIVNSQRSVKYYMFKKLTNTSNRGFALDVNDPDELKVYWDSDPDQSDADTAVSALIRDNLMTVWVLNHTDTDYPVIINPTGRTISDEPIKFTRWSQFDGLSVEGETGSISTATDTAVDANVQDNSAYCFEILLVPESVPYAHIEAEGHDSSNPTSFSTESCSDTGGGLNLSNINDGNWTRYDEIDLSNATNIRLRIARPAGRPDGVIEIRTGSDTGTVIGRTAVPVTGGWQDWCTIETPIDPTTGTHDVYLKFVEAASNESGSGAMFNVNWFEVQIATPPTSFAGAPANASQVDLSWDGVSGAVGYTVKRSTTQGGPYTIVDDTPTGTTFNDTSGLAAGTPYYYVVVTRYDGFESDESAEIAVVPSNPIVIEDVVVGPMTIGSDGGGGKNYAFSIMNSGLGHNHQAEASETLGSGDWQDAGSVLPGNGGELQFEIPIDPNDLRQFYRVRIWQQ